MSTVIDLDACIARLVAGDGGFFNTIDTALDMNPMEDLGDTPAAYLYPGWLAADPMGDGSSRQRVHNTLVIDILCRSADISQAITLVRDTFLGWEMDGEHAPFKIAYDGYQQNQACGPVDLKGGVMHWQERYQNSTHTKRIHNN